MSVARDLTPRFGVLGPLRVWHGDSVIDLGPVQQRVVLAVLLLQAGHPVSRERLISAVWGETPPTRAVNLVQRHISHLRRVLGPGSAGQATSSLAWTDAGYLLTVPGGSSTLRNSAGSCAGAGPRGRTVTCGKPPEHCITRSASGADPFATA